MSYSDDREPATETSQNKPVFLVKVQEKNWELGETWGRSVVGRVQLQHIVF